MTLALRQLVVMAVVAAQLWAGCARAATVCVSRCGHDGVESAVRHIHDHEHGCLPAPAPAHAECGCCIHLPGPGQTQQVAPRTVASDRLTPVSPVAAAPDVRIHPRAIPCTIVEAPRGASRSSPLRAIRTVRLLV
jgi:hypothetical protein